MVVVRDEGRVGGSEVVHGSSAWAGRLCTGHFVLVAVAVGLHLLDVTPLVCLACFAAALATALLGGMPAP